MTAAAARRLLVAVGGKIASGKSTISRRLAGILGAELVVADEMREELAAMGRSDAYVPGFSSTLYAEMFRRAATHLAAGHAVVLDATFRSHRLRGEARDLARRQATPFRFVECRAADAVLRARLLEREARGEPGWTRLFEHFLPLWEPVDELPADEHVVLDTSRGELALEPGVLSL